MKLVSNFISDDSGAVTVEFVVLAGAVGAITIATLLVISGNIGSRTSADSELIGDIDRNETAIDLINSSIEAEMAQD